MNMPSFPNNLDNDPAENPKAVRIHQPPTEQRASGDNHTLIQC